jgi:hypothetical protein
MMNHVRFRGRAGRFRLFRAKPTTALLLSLSLLRLVLVTACDDLSLSIRQV